MNAPSGVVTFLFTDIEGSTVGGKQTPKRCGSRSRTRQAVADSKGEPRFRVQAHR